MATLNVNIPRFYCLLRKEFLYDGQSHHGEVLNVCVFGVASIQGRALGFHVLTENGAVIWRVPLHALCHKAEAPNVPLDWLQFWDCFSYEISCTTFDRLQDGRRAGPNQGPLLGGWPVHVHPRLVRSRRCRGGRRWRTQSAPTLSRLDDGGFRLPSPTTASSGSVPLS